ncbi:hypothetical protein ACJJIU_00305 [Microbulbifer sp. CnH-101-E]|uniref:hypothetical protein n=1 Tax=unclassified Microbulbifer TaxID=2619833 RepID=UPI00403A0D75
MKPDSLPTNFSPYSEIEIAQNRLLGGKALFSFNEFMPLLVGKGATPKVWIYIPEDSTGMRWQPLVRSNRSLHELVEVTVKDRSVTVVTPDGVVLEVQESNDSKVDIIQLNLSPFGINVKLEGDVLNVMGSSLSGNLVIGSDVLIGIGNRPSEKSQKD